MIAEVGCATSVTPEMSRRIFNVIGFFDSHSHNCAVAKRFKTHANRLGDEGTRKEVQGQFDAIIAATEGAGGISPKIRGALYKAVAELNRAFLNKER